MYEVRRRDGQVTVVRGSMSRLRVSEESYVVYRDPCDATQKVSKWKELDDQQVLLALANVIELPIL